MSIPRIFLALLLGATLARAQTATIQFAVTNSATMTPYTNYLSLYRMSPPTYVGGTWSIANQSKKLVLTNGIGSISLPIGTYLATNTGYYIQFSISTNVLGQTKHVEELATGGGAVSDYWPTNWVHSITSANTNLVVTDLGSGSYRLTVNATSGTGGTSSNSTHALTADFATVASSATNALVAAQATNAYSADSALQASLAVRAYNADYTTNAQSAGTAGHADRADHAIIADNTTLSSFATSAFGLIGNGGGIGLATSDSGGYSNIVVNPGWQLTGDGHGLTNLNITATANTNGDFFGTFTGSGTFSNFLFEDASWLSYALGTNSVLSNKVTGTYQLANGNLDTETVKGAHRITTTNGDVIVTGHFYDANGMVSGGSNSIPAGVLTNNYAGDFRASSAGTSNTFYWYSPTNGRAPIFYAEDHGNGEEILYWNPESGQRFHAIGIDVPRAGSVLWTNNYGQPPRVGITFIPGSNQRGRRAWNFYETNINFITYDEMPSSPTDGHEVEFTLVHLTTNSVQFGVQDYYLNPDGGELYANYYTNIFGTLTNGIACYSNSIAIGQYSVLEPASQRIDIGYNAQNKLSIGPATVGLYQGPNSFTMDAGAGININGLILVPSAGGIQVADNIVSVSDITGATFYGNGAGITNLGQSCFPAATWTLLTNGTATAGAITNNQTGVTLTGTFSGNGGGLTNLQSLNGATNEGVLKLNGTGGLISLDPTGGLITVKDLNGDPTDVRANGFYATSHGFDGDGSNLTNLNATQLKSGTIDAARLPTIAEATHAAQATHATNSDTVATITEAQVTNALGATVWKSITGNAATATAAAGTPWITANQTITISGDATGSGTTSIAMTVTNVQQATLTNKVYATNLVGSVASSGSTSETTDDNLAGLLSALARTTISNLPARVAIVGDSWTQAGFGDHVKTNLQRSFGNGGQMGFFSPYNSLHYTPWTYTTNGTWNLSQDYMEMADPTGSLIMTNIGCKSISVYYMRRFSSVAEIWTNGVKACSVGGANDALLATNIDFGAYGQQSIWLTNIGTYFRLCAMATYSGTNGVVLFNEGKGGDMASSKVSNWANYVAGILTNSPVDSVVLALGINEIDNSAFATYQANYFDLANKIHGVLPKASIVAYSEPDVALTNGGFSLRDCDATLRAMAATNSWLHFVSGYSNSPSYTVGNSMSIYENTKHYNQVGYKMFANTLLRKLQLYTAP